MRTRTFLSIVLPGLALVTLSAQAFEPDPKCDCWYAGYEAALEFPDQGIQKHSGRYQECAGKGKTGLYEKGFEASTKKRPEQCPFAPAPVAKTPAPAGGPDAGDDPLRPHR